MALIASLLYHIGYFAITLVCMAIALFLAHRLLSWLLYAVSGIWQVISLCGSAKLDRPDENLVLLWSIFVVVMVVFFVLILRRTAENDEE